MSLRVLARLVSGLIALLLASPVLAEPPRGLDLGWSDAHALVPDAAAVHREIERLLGDAGVLATWSLSGAMPAASDADALHVMIVVSPSRPGGAGWKIHPSAMGAYLVSERSSAVFVFAPRVRDALGLGARGERLLRPRERREYARAVARVAVHELVHRLVPALPHAERGIMRRHLDQRSLTGNRLAWDEASLLALSRALERPAKGADRVASRRERDQLN